MFHPQKTGLAIMDFNLEIMKKLANGAACEIKQGTYNQLKMHNRSGTNSKKIIAGIELPTCEPAIECLDNCVDQGYKDKPAQY